MTKISIFFCFFENSSVILTFFFFVFRKSYPSLRRSIGHQYRFIRVTFVKKKLIDFFFHFQSSIFGSLELDFLICFDIDFMRLLSSHVLDHELKILIMVDLVDIMCYLLNSFLLNKHNLSILKISCVIYIKFITS